MSIRDNILGVRAARERLDLGEPVGHCWIHAISEAARSDLEISVVDPESGAQNPMGLQQFTARLLIASVHDDEGTPVFTAADVPAIRQLPAAVVRRMYEVARRVSGFDSADVDTLVGNSERPTADDSPTG